jgi:heme/copper-type cytochrome/quinol oxidase subunit 3
MSVNLSLKAVQTGKQTPAVLYMIITLILGGIFLALQYKEYNMADFNFTDSVFGSIFYFTTGAHGFHVFLGFAMLTASLICIIKNKVNTDQNLSLILPIVY